MRHDSSENKYIENNGELNFNKEKRENYESLMSNSSTNLDGYWDKNNPFVKLVLLLLGIIIVGGIIYFIFTINGS